MCTNRRSKERHENIWVNTKENRKKILQVDDTAPAGHHHYLFVFFCLHLDYLSFQLDEKQREAALQVENPNVPKVWREWKSERNETKME